MQMTSLDGGTSHDRRSSMTKMNTQKRAEQVQTLYRMRAQRPDLKAKEIAEALGVGITVVSNLMRGRTELSHERMRILTDLFGTVPESTKVNEASQFRSVRDVSLTQIPLIGKVHDGAWLEGAVIEKKKPLAVMDCVAVGQFPKQCVFGLLVDKSPYYEKNGTVAAVCVDLDAWDRSLDDKLVAVQQANATSLHELTIRHARQRVGGELDLYRSPSDRNPVRYSGANKAISILGVVLFDLTPRGISLEAHRNQ